MIAQHRATNLDVTFRVDLSEIPGTASGVPAGHSVVKPLMSYDPQDRPSLLNHRVCATLEKAESASVNVVLLGNASLPALRTTSVDLPMLNHRACACNSGQQKDANPTSIP